MPITDKYRLEGGITESWDFADFVHQRSTPMLCTAWLLTGGDWALAEDLAQTAFSQLWRHWTRVSVMDAPEAYAHKVMLNTFLSWRRRRWTAEIPPNGSMFHLLPPADSPRWTRASPCAMRFVS